MVPAALTNVAGTGAHLLLEHISNWKYIWVEMRRSDTAKLNATFAALADPTRRAILARLCLGEATVTELIGPSGLSQPAVSKHLKVLQAAGLVERRRDARFHRCRLRADRLADAWAWIGDYREFWERSFDRLEVYVKHLHHLEKGAPHERKKQRP